MSKIYLAKKSPEKKVAYLCMDSSFFMSTIYYTLSRRKNALGQSEILIRFSHGKINQRAKTGIFVNPKYWHAGAIRLPNLRLLPNQEIQSEIDTATEAQRRLADITALVTHSFNEQARTKIPLHWLRSLVETASHTDSRSATLWDSYKAFIDSRTVSDGRIRVYRVIERSLRRFELYKRQKHPAYTLTLLDLATVDTVNEFECYLRNESVLPYTIENYAPATNSRAPQPRGQNTLTGKMKILRAFLNWAHTNDLIPHNPFRKRQIAPAVYGTPVYLSIEERNRLRDANLSRHPAIAVQRDIFIFQCLIGCRVGDLLTLERSNIVNGAVEYIPRKTKEGRPVTVRVPLNASAQTILARYDDPTRKALLPFITAQRYNDAIRKAFLGAGLNRQVQVLNTVTREPEIKPLYSIASSHMARRTFIGNLYKQVKDPNLIARLSGHTEGSAAFARYRDIDEEMKVDLVKLLE